MATKAQLTLPLYGRISSAWVWIRDLTNYWFPRPASRGVQTQNPVMRLITLRGRKGEVGEEELGAQAAIYYRMSAEQGRVFRKVLEFMLSACAVLLGCQLAVGDWPPSSIDHLFLPMQFVAPAIVWGSLFVLLGLTRLAVLIINGRWRPTHQVRKWLSLGFLGGVWLPLGACYWTQMFKAFPVWTPETNMAAVFCMTVVACEYLIFYAHTSFVWIRNNYRRGV